MASSPGKPSHNYGLANHQYAQKAAEAAECAGRQNKFWDFHDSLFRDQQHLDQPSLLARPAELGLLKDPFERCLAGDADVAGKIRSDRESGEALGVDGTPAFFFGMQTGGAVVASSRVTGAQPIAEFTKVLDELLSEQKGKNNKQ